MHASLWLSDYLNNSPQETGIAPEVSFLGEEMYETWYWYTGGTFIYSRKISHHFENLSEHLEVKPKCKEFTYQIILWSPKCFALARTA